MAELYIPKPLDLLGPMQKRQELQQGQQRLDLLREQGGRAQQGLDLSREQFEQKKKGDTIKKRVKFIELMKDVDEKTATDMLFKTLDDFPSTSSLNLDRDKVRANQGKFLTRFTGIFKDFNDETGPHYQNANRVKIEMSKLYAEYPKHGEPIKTGIKAVEPTTGKAQTGFGKYLSDRGLAMTTENIKLHKPAYLESIKKEAEAKRAPEKPEITEPKARKRLTDLETAKVKLQAGKGLDRIERALMAQFAPGALEKIDEGDVSAALSQIDDEIAFYKDFLGEEVPEIPEEVTPKTRYDYSPSGGFTEVK